LTKPGNRISTSGSEKEHRENHTDLGQDETNDLAVSNSYKLHTVIDRKAPLRKLVRELRSKFCAEFIRGTDRI